MKDNGGQPPTTNTPKLDTSTPNTITIENEKKFQNEYNDSYNELMNLSKKKSAKPNPNQNNNINENSVEDN